MSKAEIGTKAALYRRLATAKFLQEETRVRYLAVAVLLEWQLTQRRRPEGA